MSLALFGVLLVSVFFLLPSLQMNHDREENKGAEKTQNESAITVIDRLDVNNTEGANNYSSGRIELWKEYAKRLNLVGNDYKKTIGHNLQIGKILVHATCF